MRRKSKSSRETQSPSGKSLPKDESATDQSEPDDISVKDEQPAAAAPKEPVTLKKVLIRSITASFLAALYLSLLYGGHFYCILAVVITQTELYREVVAIRYVEARERQMPWFRTLQWGWFSAAMVLVYGETLHRFCSEHKIFNQFLYITENFSTLAYVMYWTLFILSVLSLKPGLIRFQLSQHMWSIVTICIVVFQCKNFPDNTLNGIFWFFFPMACVIMNDVSAYFAGISFGRKFISTPFLALSPNKTWEGFIGAFFCTMVFAFFFPALLAQYSWFICPAEGIQAWPLPSSLHCDPLPVFIPKLYDLPVIGNVWLYPIQFHGLAYGMFSSLVAPFGGFFASAIKRAYKKKDFDSFMPGHGGMMDRMDCQLLMITFNSFYYSYFIAPKALSLERMLLLISQMSDDNKVALFKELGSMLGEKAAQIVG